MRYPTVTAEARREIEEQTSNKWSVPDTARKSKRNPKLAWWRERVVINDMNVSETETDSGNTHEVYELHFTILPRGGSGVHNDKELIFFGRTNVSAFEDGQDGTDARKGQITMTRLTIDKIEQLLRACGIESDDGNGGFLPETLQSAFPEDGTTNLVNREVDVEIKQSFSDEYGWQREASNYFPIAETTAAVEV